MYKLLLVLIPLLITACSVSYEDYLDKNKTRLPYSNIEIRLPKMLDRVSWGSNMYRSKDGALVLSVIGSDQGYHLNKDTELTMIKSGKYPYLALSSFASTSTDSGIDSYEVHTKAEKGTRDIAYNKKFGIDGDIGIEFGIHSDDQAVHDKLAGIAQASLKTLSHSQTPIDLGEGLFHKAGQIDDMHLSLRDNQTAVYKKKDMFISVHYTTVPHYDNAIYSRYIDNAKVYADEDYHSRRCEEILTEKAEEILISNNKGKKAFRTQKCRSRTHTGYRTEIRTKNNGIFTIDMALPGRKEHELSSEFYNQFLEKLIIP